MTGEDRRDGGEPDSLRQGTVERTAAMLDGGEQSSESGFTGFVHALFEPSDVDDLEQYDPEALANVARSIWQLIERRAPGQRLVTVYNPVREVHGFASPHTVIQVVTDDMPFIIDSVLGELNAGGYPVRRILHPILEVQRDAQGQRLQIERAAVVERDSWAERYAREKGFFRESIMHMEIDRQPDDATCKTIEAQIVSVLSDVRVVVDDWRAMQANLNDAVLDLQRSAPPTIDRNDLRESVAFLNWLLGDHFAFLGMRDYEIVGDAESGELVVRTETGLGLLRDPEARVLRRRGQMVVMTPEVREFLLSPQPIIVSKANVRSRVHRRVYMDYIGIKRYNRAGAVIGERRLVGLFTAAAYNRSPRDIPLLSRKIALVLERAQIPQDSHDERALGNILETYPRDELFQASVDELLETCTGILRLQKRPHTKIFARYDRFDRFASVLVYVPRDKYDTDLRQRIAHLLREAFEGRVSAFTPSFGAGSPLIRVHFIIGRDVESATRVDLRALEHTIDGYMRDWQSDLETALAHHHGTARGRALAARYAQGFSSNYRERFAVTTAIQDLDRIDVLGAKPALDLHFYRLPGDPVTEVRLKLYHWGRPIPLSDCLVVLENMGLKVSEEVPYTVELERDAGATAGGVDPETDTDGRKIFIHDFIMTHRLGQSIDLDAVKDPFETAFRAIWSGKAENDGFNRLVVDQALTWREVVILRALSRFLRQVGVAYSDAYIVNGLCEQPEIARLLVQLFEWRFDPDISRSEEERCDKLEQIVADITTALDAVQSLDIDRIIRRFMNLITAAQRTNFYQLTDDGDAKTYLSIKFASKKIQGLPQPKPLYEVFVYSPRFEGVHLRGGKVARGGIRWSDRPEDFRSEVLGLVKAQLVKNSVIVPVGAKGGFVPKHLPGPGASRDAVVEEAIACYRLFISGLLDLTDNITDAGINAPQRVVAYDEADTYLVVAADKGTATFSDIANDVAASYGFWLGDAFASGGRVGYDHKKMGITARGAWEAVKRHFRELGTDIQTTPFTAAGVGDMSGDVFGNGMLLSTQTRLVAAFDHRDIFLDPDPDIAASYAERQRLFALPRSSWADYDRSLISRGGGIFSRRSKSITLSPEAASALGGAPGAIAPNELISAILAAPVDLLWFGGIGTYIKARDEAHIQVSDRTNDPLRIDAHRVRARVIGEGANLGVTQRGRIDYARAGGRINTDFVDNAGGVDCSDHEVNIKIALDTVVSGGALTVDARNAVLEDMTDEVAQLVLESNYDQTLALTLAEITSPADIDAHTRFMRLLERSGALTRSVEFLPDEDAIRDLKEANYGLTRPEIAVLLAYSKIALFDSLVPTAVPDDPHLETDLIGYFPKPLQQHFRPALTGHRLRREIISTLLANDLVNTAGLTFVSRIQESMGVPVPEIVRAYVIARDVFSLPDLRTGIHAHDGQAPAFAQLKAYEAIRVFLRRQVLWFLRYRPGDLRMSAAIEAYRHPVHALASRIEATLSPFEADRMTARIAQAAEDGLSADVARGIAMLEPLASACDIIDVATNGPLSVTETACAYFALGEALHLDKLRADAYDLGSDEHWERLAIRRTVEDLFRQQRLLTDVVIGHGGERHGDVHSGREIVTMWLEENSLDVERVIALVQDMESSGPLNSAKLSLAGSQIRDLISGLGGRYAGPDLSTAAT